MNCPPSIYLFSLASCGAARPLPHRTGKMFRNLAAASRSATSKRMVNVEDLYLYLYFSGFGLLNRARVANSVIFFFIIIGLN